MDGFLTRIGWCYPPSEDERFKLAVIECGDVRVKVLYVEPVEALLGKRVLQGQIIGKAQDVTLKVGDNGLYRDQGMLPHLHTECYVGGDLVNPCPLMRIDE